MDIRGIREEELEAVCAWLATVQADPSCHIAYVAQEAEAIAEGLRGLEPDGLDGVLVAEAADSVVGLLAAEHDVDPPRVWWHGPFASEGQDAIAVSTALLAGGRARLPGHVTQEEFGPDDRHAWLGEVAEQHGFVPEEASAVLERALDGELDDLPSAAGALDAVVIVPSTEATASAVATLHDSIFPGTHSTGVRIAAGGCGRIVLVAVRPGEVLGYVAAERQEDGTGYIDYLGVAAGARGSGIGRALVAAACLDLSERFRCPSASLTVRESNVAARRLYASLGFAEERLIRPWRRGFSLADLGTPPA